MPWRQAQACMAWTNRSVCMQKVVLEPPFFLQCLIFLVRMLSAHVKESKTVWIRRRGFRITGTGFWITIVSGIPDSLSCIPDFRSPIFWNPQAKMSRIPDSLSCVPDSTGKFSLDSPRLELARVAVARQVQSDNVTTNLMLVLIFSLPKWNCKHDGVYHWDTCVSKLWQLWNKRDKMLED